MSVDCMEQIVLNQLISNQSIGLAMVATDNLSIKYENKQFSSWLPGTGDLLARIPKLKLEKLKNSLDREKPYILEYEIKVNRRSKVLKLEFSQSEGEHIFILAIDYSKEKEKEYLLDSYIRMAEENKRQLENSLALIKRQKQELIQINADLERERNSVELRALQAVINPHFVSNCLSSIQGFIVDKNTEEAVNYLSHFGNLMRLSFEQSYFDYVSIEEILDLLNTYVSIEKMRMDYAWEYSLTIDKKINTSNSKIPPLLIQPFVENAIWHGINRKRKGGKIQISLDLLDELTLKCTIEDNGVGRKHNKAIETINKEKKNVGLHSLNVTNKRLAILWQEHKKKYDILYTDLQNEKGKPSGTRVELFIPVNF